MCRKASSNLKQRQQQHDFFQNNNRAHSGKIFLNDEIISKKLSCVISKKRDKTWWRVKVTVHKEVRMLSELVSHNQKDKVNSTLTYKELESRFNPRSPNHLGEYLVYSAIALHNIHGRAGGGSSSSCLCSLRHARHSLRCVRSCMCLCLCVHALTWAQTWT